MTRTAIRMLRLGAALASLALCGDAGAADFATIFQYQNGNPVGLGVADGILYGTEYDTPDFNCGGIFQLQPPSGPGGAWSKTVIYVLAGRPSDGCGPVSAPIAGPGGVLYGVTYVGGAADDGTVYALQPPATPGGAWTEAVLYSFPGPPGSMPFGPILAPDGTIYAGAAYLGANGSGAIYQLQPPSSPGGPWTTTDVFDFPANTRIHYQNPDSLSLGSDGAFYGTIPLGGEYKYPCGAVFKLQPPSAPGGQWAETILYNFRCADDGVGPNSVMLGPDGVLYGTTFGVNTDFAGAGMVFSLTPPATPGGEWTKKNLHTFINYEVFPNVGYGPDSPLIMRNGKLYGASGLPGLQANHPGGVVYELAPPATPGGPWTCTILHRWRNGQVPSNGSVTTDGSIAMDRDGTVFGGTSIPNAAQGTIYRVKPD